MTDFLQFRLLLWKSVKTAARSPLKTLLEMLIPYLILLNIGSTTPPVTTQLPEKLSVGQLEYTEFSAIHEDQFNFRCESSICSNVTRGMTHFCSKYLVCGSHGQSLLVHHFDKRRVGITVHSSRPLSTTTFISSHTETTARDFDFSTDKHHSIDSLIRLIATIAKESTNLTKIIDYESLDRPKHQTEEHFILGDYMTTIWLALIPLLLTINVTREIATEQESKMKDYLHVMGMGRSVYYAHHFTFAFLKSLPYIVSSCFILEKWLYGIFLAILYLFFIFSQISIAILVSTIVRKPTSATIAIALSILGSNVLSALLPLQRKSILLSALACLNPSHAFELGLDTIREFALRESFIIFSEISFALPYACIVLILLFDSCMFIFLAIHIDHLVSTWHYRSYFPSRNVEDSVEEDENGVNIHEDVESLSHLPVEVELSKVTKTWPTGERAVREVDINLYKGQTTVLLGHNGAGKSTTFDMIAGMTKPTSGQIRIGSITSSHPPTVGFCPQYDPVFPKMTIKEHLHFFASLRGVQDWKKEGERMLDALSLYHKRNKLALKLSSGMRRKLSVAISMIGRNSIVLLDEPTVGVDSNYRRDIERLIVGEKRRRTILLTTHYTDEAENVGDRILIMAGGRVVCSGSPHFLNQEFGSGCVLTCTICDGMPIHEAVNRTFEIVQRFSLGAKIERKYQRHFEIWLDKKNCESFPEMFRELEDRQKALGLSCFGLSNNSLDEVFLKVVEMTGTTERANIDEALRQLMKENEFRSGFLAKTIKQVMFLLYKRLLYEWASMLSVVLNIVPIIIFTALFSIVLRSEGEFWKESKPAEQLIDLMRFPDCGRIGIEQNLEISSQMKERLAREKCFEIEEIGPNAVEWYDASAVVRRPRIIAAINLNNATGAITVHVPPGDRLNILPLHMALVRAMTTTPIEIKVLFNYTRSNNLEHGDTISHRLYMYPKEFELAFTISHLIMCIILLYRVIGFYVVERTCFFTHQQFVTGLSRSLYWIVSFFSDFSLFILNFTVLCILYFVFDIPLLHFGKLAPLSIIACIITLIKVYIVQRSFKSKATAENCIFLYSVGLLLLSLAAIKYEHDKRSKNHLSPKINFFYDYTLYLDPCATIIAPLAFPTMAAYEFDTVHYLFVQLISVLVVFIFLETRPPIGRFIWTAADKCLFKEEYLPREEKDIVLEVIDLKKQYSKWGLVVKGLTFDVKRRQCLGLLGMNGAGKTTTLDLITGRIEETEGRATVNGIACAAPADVGYCSQSDALMMQLTGRQNLHILAALHGYSNAVTVTDAVLQCVGMTTEADRLFGSYSGGQRRKISVAAAMLAQNSLIVLDEPTAGIDPVTRRDVWSAIVALRESTKAAIVLTSHSMAEVEALCSQVAIMKGGLIVKTGNPHTLKAKHGCYFKLTLFISNPNIYGVLKRVQSVYPLAQLIIGTCADAVVIGIPHKREMRWSDVFEECMKLSKTLQAYNFCLTQANLEDVFLYLVRDRRRQPEYIFTDETHKQSNGVNGVNHKKPLISEGSIESNV